MEKEYEGRMSSVETKLENIENYLVRLDGKLDAWQQNYVPRSELGEMFRARDENIRKNYQAIEKLKDEIKTDQRSTKAVWPTWITALIAAAALIVSLWPN